MNDKPYSDYVKMPDTRILLCDTLRAELNLTMAELGKVEPNSLTDTHTERLYEAVRLIRDARAGIRRANKGVRSNRTRRRSKSKAK